MILICQVLPIDLYQRGTVDKHVCVCLCVSVFSAMCSRFGCIYHYDFELFRQRMLGEEGVTQLLFKYAGLCL